MDNEFWRMAGATGAQLACTSTRVDASHRHGQIILAPCLPYSFWRVFLARRARIRRYRRRALPARRAFISNGSGGRSGG